MCGVRKHIKYTGRAQAIAVFPGQDAQVTRQRARVTGDIHHPARGDMCHGAQNLAGADPGKEAPRRVSRRLVEVNLPGARRLAFSVPLTLLARADRIVRVRAVPR